MSEDTLRRAVAEMIGAFTLTFVGAGAAAAAGVVHDTALIGVAIANGLAIGVMVCALGYISGGHFNPAITFGFLITRRIKPALAGVYWVAQFGGAALAALLVKELLPRASTEAVNLGVPALGHGVDAGSGVPAGGDLHVLFGARRVRRGRGHAGPVQRGSRAGDRPDDLDRRAIRRAVHRRGDEPLARVRAAARRRPLGQRLGLVRGPGARCGVAALLYHFLFLGGKTEAAAAA